MTRILAVVNKSVETLTKYAQNSRLHDEAQVAQLVFSIQEFGFTNPILVDENDMIIAGHGRLAAAEILGMDIIPTIQLNGLTEEQKRAYVIADNKLALNASWDDRVLMFELQDLESLGVDLGITGFDDAEISKLFTNMDDADHSDKTHAEDEWKGMPEFNSDDPCYRKVTVNFDTQEAVDNFFALIGQEATEKTKSIWHPEKEQRKLKDVRYSTDE